MAAVGYRRRTSGDALKVLWRNNHASAGMVYDPGAWKDYTLSPSEESAVNVVRDPALEALREVSELLLQRIVHWRTIPRIGSRGAIVKELHRLRSEVNERIDELRCAPSPKNWFDPILEWKAPSPPLADIRPENPQESERPLLHISTSAGHKTMSAEELAAVLPAPIGCEEKQDSQVVLSQCLRQYVSCRADDGSPETWCENCRLQFGGSPAEGAKVSTPPSHDIVDSVYDDDIPF